MTDYYLSTGIVGTDTHEIVKGADINKARKKARKILDDTGKPVRVYRIIEKGTSTQYLGKVKRWGYYVDRYGIDRTDIYACWVDVNGFGHQLRYDGSVGKKVRD